MAGSAPMIEKKSFDTLVTTASCLIMAMLVYYAGNKYGPGLTFDSVNYLYAGHSLAEEGELMRPFRTPFIEWPPLYPLLIGAVSYLPGALLSNVFYFQILVAALTVGLSCNLARKLICNRTVFVTACLSLAFATPLILVNHFVWSESFFVFLIVLQIHLLGSYTQKPIKFLWVLLVLNGLLLCMQRQVGAFFVAGGACVLLLYPDSYSLQKRAAASLLYALLAALVPLLVWWLRNYQLSGLIMNDYRDSLFLNSLFSHTWLYHDIITSWLLPDEVALWIRISVFYGIILLLFLVYSHFRTAISHQPTIIILGFLFWSYFLLLFLISYVVTEQIDDRKLAPVYIPGMLLLFGLFDVLIRNKPYITKKWLLYGCLIWTVYPVSRALYNVHHWHQTATPTQLPQPVEEAFREKLRFNR
jgi:hypothetical protein